MRAERQGIRRARLAAGVVALVVMLSACEHSTGAPSNGRAPAGNAVVDVNGGDTRGLRLRPRSAPGAPTTGRWNKGTMILDSGANLFICTATGTPAR